jgi:hypothetical protein
MTAPYDNHGKHDRIVMAAFLLAIFGAALWLRYG